MNFRPAVPKLISSGVSVAVESGMGTAVGSSPQATMSRTRKERPERTIEYFRVREL